jgi:hypothetical protein
VEDAAPFMLALSKGEGENIENLGVLGRNAAKNTQIFGFH